MRNTKVLNKMKILGLLLLITTGCLRLSAANLPDFVVTDILRDKDSFICIKIQNLSPVDTDLSLITPETKEKIFLTIFINNTKRSEYKLKYMDMKLFKQRGSILFRTNFRLQQGPELRVKAHINPQNIIQEINSINNTFEKKMSPDKK
jgi:hypothetical protein